MTQPIPVVKGPIAVLDMLGFEDFVNQNSLTNVIDAYAHIITSATHTVNILSEEFQFMVYSDTIALRLVNNSEGGFYRFIKALQLIAHRYFYTNQIPGFLTIPVRGAIVFGEYSWHNGNISTQVIDREPIVAKAINFILGAAIIDAHKHEKSQNWIGLSIDPKNAEVIRSTFPNAFSRLLSERYIIEYDIPRKTGSTRGFAINPTCRATFLHEFEAFLNTCECAISQSTTLPEVLAKLRNTLIFLYHIYSQNELLPLVPADFPTSYNEIDITKVQNLINRMESFPRK